MEGCESQFFRFNRSMTYWYIMLSLGGAIIANKYLCLKGVRKKIWNLGSGPDLVRVRSGSDPQISSPKKIVDQTRTGPQISQKK